MDSNPRDILPSVLEEGFGFTHSIKGWDFLLGRESKTSLKWFKRGVGSTDSPVSIALFNARGIHTSDLLGRLRISTLVVDMDISS